MCGGGCGVSPSFLVGSENVCRRFVSCCLLLGCTTVPAGLGRADQDERQLSLDEGGSGGQQSYL